jgi:hypothetical protein
VNYSFSQPITPDTHRYIDMELMDRLTLKAFLAPDEPALCAEFISEHRKVLEDFGIGSVTTNTAAWTTDPDTYVIAAFSERSGMVGGIRVEVHREGKLLPIEEALIKLDPNVHHTLNRLGFGGNAEVCGLWNANRYGARGLPPMLAFAAVSLANQLKLKTMVCLASHYTLRHALKAGFTIIEELGNGGSFDYPIPNFKGIAMVIPDVLTLDTAPYPYRNQLLSLRLRPEQSRLEVLNGTPTMLDYHLRISGVPIDMWAYRSIVEDRSHYAETA